jgi:hypothetical protein
MKREIPWPQIVAEGTAVVISILLAFAIDAGWDERKERQDELRTLQALRIEFEANRVEARAVVAHHEESVRRLIDFKTASAAEIRSWPLSEREKLVRAFASPRTFDPERGSIRALIGAGRLGILQNAGLRASLMTFMTIVEDADEDRYYMGQTSLWVWQDMLRFGGPWRVIPGNVGPENCSSAEYDRHCYILEQTGYLPQVTADELLLMRADAQLMGLIDRNKIHSIRYAAEVNEMLAQIEHIIEHINEGLRQP